MNTLIRTSFATLALAALALLPTRLHAVQYGNARIYTVEGTTNAQMDTSYGSDVWNNCGCTRYLTTYMWKKNNAVVNAPGSPYTATAWATDYYEQTKTFNVLNSVTTLTYFYLFHPKLKLTVPSVTAPGTCTATLTLRNDADTANAKVRNSMVLTLASSNTAVATVPATVTVSANSTTATFTVTGVAAGTATITATASWGGSIALPITVN